MPNYKIRIVLVGPSMGGKSKLANFLADLNYKLPKDVQQTKALRILEYDINDVQINNEKSTIDVQLWDTSGREEYSNLWRVYRANADALVFIHSDDENSSKKLDSLYSFFIGQNYLSPKQCLVCNLTSEDTKYSLPPKLSKIAQINFDLETEGDKFKQEFQKFVLSVITNNLDN